MKILILGKRGQVSRELQRSCSVVGEVLTLGSEVLDLGSAESIRKNLQAHKPDFVINAAAYTAVDQAEKDEACAMAVNGHALLTLGEEAKKLGARIIHYSTDYVFDGSKVGPYTEQDEPCPLGVYGRSKLLGETLLKESGASHVTLRVSWVYGNTGHNFLNTMLRLGQEREELKIVADQVGAPTWARHIAEVTAHILKDKDFDSKQGLYHLAPQGAASWYDFASKIFEICRRDSALNLAVKHLSPISTAEYPTPAQRPQNSLMSSEKIRAAFGVSLPDWEQSLELVLKDRWGR